MNRKFMELQEEIVKIDDYTQRELGIILPKFQLKSLPAKLKKRGCAGRFVSPDKIQIDAELEPDRTKVVLAHESGEYICDNYWAGIKELKECENALENGTYYDESVTRHHLRGLKTIKEGWCEYFSYSVVRDCFGMNIEAEQIRRKPNEDDYIALRPGIYSIGFHYFLNWEQKLGRSVLKEGLNVTDVFELAKKG